MKPLLQPHPGRISTVHPALGAGLLALATLLPPPAHAVDGCLVLLCLAAPSWKSIPQCVDPVRTVLRDLARGRPFPTCSMSGAGNSAGNRPSMAPMFCPPQYTHLLAFESNNGYVCDYEAAIEVNINGALWSRTWWRRSGDSVTEYTAAAKAQLGDFDSQFDDDYASWLAQQPAPPIEPVN